MIGLLMHTFSYRIDIVTKSKLITSKFSIQATKSQTILAPNSIEVFRAIFPPLTNQISSSISDRVTISLYCSSLSMMVYSYSWEVLLVEKQWSLTVTLQQFFIAVDPSVIIITEPNTSKIVTATVSQLVPLGFLTYSLHMHSIPVYL